VFHKDIEAREKLAHEKEAEGTKLKPADETEAIADIIKRINEIEADLKRESSSANQNL
jgi:hypothetical protein